MQNFSTIRLIVRGASQKNLRGVASTPCQGEGYGAKVIFGRKMYDHGSDLLQRLRWLSAENMALYHTLCAVLKVVRHREPEQLAAGFVAVAEMREVSGVPSRATRQDRDLYVPRSRTEMGKRRFSCRGPMAAT